MEGSGEQVCADEAGGSRVTAERRIIVTMIAKDPFIIWRTKHKSLDELKEIIAERKLGEDIFIKDDRGDLEITVVSGS